MQAAYFKAEKIARNEHVPVMVHVQEITQPQGHSTSGSHERYKGKERLKWEKAHDCNLKFREWILDQKLADESELVNLEKEAKKAAKKGRLDAWNDFIQEIKEEQAQAVDIMEALSQESVLGGSIIPIITQLKKTLNPIRLDLVKAIKKILRITRNEETSSRASLVAWLKRYMDLNEGRYSSHVMSESAQASYKVKAIAPVYSESSPLVDGREVLQACFDSALSRDPRVFAIGEDVGKIGDVNQAFAGLQDKHSELRVTDTGIRETTIIGQGIGAALRGLRPITEIQYLDYLLYAVQTLSDDLATLHHRTAGGQKAPLIIRTRGHRLEGVWHSGSPISMILGSLRGINVLVPRNMTQAAGFTIQCFNLMTLP